MGTERRKKICHKKRKYFYWCRPDAAFPSPRLIRFLNYFVWRKKKYEAATVENTHELSFITMKRRNSCQTGGGKGWAEGDGCRSIKHSQWSHNPSSWTSFLQTEWKLAKWMLLELLLPVSFLARHLYCILRLYVSHFAVISHALFFPETTWCKTTSFTKDVPHIEIEFGSVFA